MKNPLIRYVATEDGDVMPETDDGELASELEDFLLDFIVEIEDCSTFEAEKQLTEIIRKLTKLVGE